MDVVCLFSPAVLDNGMNVMTVMNKNRSYEQIFQYEGTGKEVDKYR